MNKTELVNSVSVKASLKKSEASAAVNAVIDAIAEALAAGEKIQVAGIGTFAVKTRAARTGRNPKTQATITIPAAKYVAFSAAKSLKDGVNK